MAIWVTMLSALERSIVMVTGSPNSAPREARTSSIRIMDRYDRSSTVAKNGVGALMSNSFLPTTENPKRRLFELLRSQGMQMNQQITFLTDGADDVRDLPRFLNPQAEYWLDWFDITMRLTVLGQMAKGLRSPEPTGTWAAELAEDEVRPLLRRHEELVTGLPRELERLKWFLWHGNVFRVLQIVEALEFDLQVFEDTDVDHRKLLKTVREFDTYLRANAEAIPNYGELRRAGEHISTGFAESTINVVVAKRSGSPGRRACPAWSSQQPSCDGRPSTGVWTSAGPAPLVTQILGCKMVAMRVLANSCER